MGNFKTYLFSLNQSELLENPSEDLQEVERRGPAKTTNPEIIKEPPELNGKPPEELPKLDKRELVEPIEPEINENLAEKIQDRETANKIKEDGQEPKMKKVRSFADSS